MTEAKVLVADDEEYIRDLVSSALRIAGFESMTADDGSRALAAVATHRPDLLILDVGMPRLDGFAVLQRVRQTSDVPVIFLTGRAEEVDRVVGLELGADDYVLKPYSLRELVARVRARLRRPGTTAAPAAEGGVVLDYDGLRVDTRAHEVTVSGSLIDLTTREYELLAFLAAHPRQVFTREQLLESVWGTRYQDPATVTEHVRRVRMKVEGASDGRAWITTLRGTGYRFDP